MEDNDVSLGDLHEILGKILYQIELIHEEQEIYREERVFSKISLEDLHAIMEKIHEELVIFREERAFIDRNIQDRRDFMEKMRQAQNMAYENEKN